VISTYFAVSDARELQRLAVQVGPREHFALVALAGAAVLPLRAALQHRPAALARQDGPGRRAVGVEPVRLERLVAPLFEEQVEGDVLGSALLHPGDHVRAVRRRSSLRFEQVPDCGQARGSVPGVQGVHDFLHACVFGAVGMLCFVGNLLCGWVGALRVRGFRRLVR
jgi:hypothetical protein